MLNVRNKNALAYITGVALGDGNLSNPNGRAIRLRITCDLKYPNIIEEIYKNLRIVAPNNKISIIKKKAKAVDVSCYSNDWEKLLGWKVGSKLKQKVQVPTWIKEKQKYSIKCLQGLLQTDGSIYYDRGYCMINFVNHGENLAKDVFSMIESLGYRARMSIIAINTGTNKYTIRLVKDAERFIKYIKLEKK